MSLQRLAFRLRNSLWFIPGLWVIGAGLLAFAMTWLDSVTQDLNRSLPLVFGGGPDGARSVLSSIAGSTITVAGVTFSITIVALQLASSQFSPRVLRDFMRDRVSQSVLGSFIGAFFYALLVLRSIRSADETGPEFVPSLSVTTAIVLAILAVVMLIYFIHHISTRIQVSSIVAGIASATERAFEGQRVDDGDGGARHHRSHTEPPDGESGNVAAGHSGYLQLVDRDGLLELARELDLVLRLEVAPGDWVQRGAPVISVWPAASGSEHLSRRLNGCLTYGPERSLDQDPAFGLRQLVDVAVKALSPGINDPTTARDCIRRVTQVLVAAGRAGQPVTHHADDEGRLRLVERGRGFAQLVSLGFDEIRHHGARIPEVAIALGDALRTLGALLPPALHSPLADQASLLREAAALIEPGGERRRVEARLNDLPGA
jgi:uncharacterized membrane protein